MKVKCPSCKGKERIPVLKGTVKGTEVPIVRLERCNICNGEGKIETKETNADPTVTPNK
jgi:hypothetical protein